VPNPPKGFVLAVVVGFAWAVVEVEFPNRFEDVFPKRGFGAALESEPVLEAGADPVLPKLNVGRLLWLAMVEFVAEFRRKG
jgi:hypothetical protein